MESVEVLNKRQETSEAWISRKLDILLSALKGDSEFPENFDLDVLDPHADNVKRLAAFVAKRNQIHRSITESDKNQLETLVFNRKSKLYLNTKNESAVFTAIQNKQFQIYAFLKSVGAEFKDENEKAILNCLSVKEKLIVQNHLIYYFPRSPNSHIYYLISKSRSSNPVSGINEKVKELYETLEKIPEVSKILQIVQYSDYLDVVFDFENENVREVCLHATDKTRGETRYTERRLFIAAGQEHHKVLGTLAHELTHMAMEIVYENECNPYRKNDGSQFHATYNLIKDKINKSDGEISKVIMEGFRAYDPDDHHSELVARIPHVLAQFQEEGREWLVREAEDLLNYFNDVILVECQKFIDRSYLLKPRNQIRWINDSLGEMKKLQTCSILFKDVTLIERFLRDGTAKVFIIKGESTWLAMLRTLQSLYGSDYINNLSKYLALKFDEFALEAKKILTTFLYEVCDTLILHYPPHSKIRTNECLQENVMELLLKLFETSSNKRIIFVTNHDLELSLTKLLKKFHIDFHTIEDERVTLVDLEEKSQNVILSKKIRFQGRRTSINRLVKDDKTKKLMNGKTIQALVQNCTIRVGTRVIGFPSVDSAYADLQEKINVNLLTDDILNSDDACFIFDGFDQMEDILRIIKKSYEGNMGYNTFRRKFAEKGNVKLAKEKLTDEKFKEICKRGGEDCRAYWIQTNNDKSCLILRKLYNPEFYIERNFFMYKIIAIKISEIEELSKCKGVKCLISNITSEEFSALLRNTIHKEEASSEENGNSLKLLQVGAQDSKSQVCVLKLHLKGKNIEVITRKQKREAIRSVRVDYSKPFETGIIIETDHGCNLLKGEEKNNEIKPVDTSQIIFTQNDKEAEDVFRELIKTENTVYWLKKDGGCIIYKDSRGSLQNLKNCIDLKNCVMWKIYDSCLIDMIKDNQVVLLSDDPGMGKTTTLTALCGDEFDDRKSWIVKINLKLLSKCQFQINDKTDLITSLSKTGRNLNNDLARILLLSALDKEYYFPMSLLFVFDGFNEVLDENDREKIISLLKYLKDETKAKFWITTRPHCKELLEDSLSVFALELQPMDDNEKKELVSTYLINRLQLTVVIQEEEAEELISLYAEKFLHNVEHIFQNSKFIGSPLQLHLMLESATENFKNWAHSENRENPDFSYIGQNVLEIYSNFIHKRYEYFKKLKNEGNEYSLEEIQSICDLCHLKLAEILTLDSDPDVSLENFEGVNNALACGIVTCQNGRLIFIHSTFQEYYASKLFLNWIKEPDRFSNYGKLEFIFKKIFLEADFEIIRLFLDCRFKDVKVKSLPSVNIKTASEILQKLLQREDDNETFLEVAIQEEHANVFDFVISLLLRRKMINFFDIKCRFNDTVLIYACRCNKTRIVEVILEKCGEVFNECQFFEYLCVKGQSKETCLHHSAFYCNTDILKLLFDKAKEVVSSETEFQEFLNLKDDWKNTILHLAASNLGEIFSAIIKGYKEKYFEESHQMIFVLLYRIRHKFLFPELPYEVLYKHFWRVMLVPVADAENEFDLFNAIFQFHIPFRNRFNFTAYNAITLILEQHVSACEKQSMIHSRNLKGFDATHVAVAYGDMNSAEFLLSQINGPIRESEKQDVNVSFDSRNYGQYCALNIAAMHGQITIFRLLLENIPPDEIHKVFIMSNFQGFNILHVTVCFGRADILKLLLKKVKNVCLENLKSFLVSKGENGLNPLHLAVQNGNFTVVDMLLREAEELSFEFEYVTSVNDENYNPIQSAANNGSREIFELLFNKIPAEKKEETLLNRDGNGLNALIIAATRGSNDIIQFIHDRLKETTDIFETFWNCQTMNKCDILSCAVGNGHLDTTRMFLQLAKEISSDFEYEFLTSINVRRHNAFNNAIMGNHSDIFKYMLDKIPVEKMYDFLNFSDDQGYNVLHYSAFFGSSDIVSLVLNKVKLKLKENFEEYLFRKTNYGLTPLHLAAERGHLNVVEILLQFTAEKSPALQYEYLTTPDDKKSNAIHMAIGMNNAEITSLLLKQIPPKKIYETFTIPEEKGINILHLSARRGNVEILKKILNTIKENSIEKLERFLQSKCDGGFHSLQLAVQEGHCNVVQVLLQYGSEISPEFHRLFLTSTNDNGENAIYTSIFSNRSEVTELLLNEILPEIMYETLWQFNRKNFNSLLLSAFKGDYNTIKLILDKFKQNATQENFRAFLHSNTSDIGFNALHFAAQEGHFDAVKILLKYASDFHCEYLTSITRKKRNAIHIAIITHHCNIASWLLNQIPEDILSKTISLTDIENGNILHYAAFYGPNDLVQTILKAKKRSLEDLKQLLNSQMINHGNPLHLAAYQGHLDTTEILLQHANEISPQFQYEYLISVNGKRCNVFHMATVQKPNVLACLINNIPKSEIYEVLSALDDESFDVLHLLAYNGNKEAIELILNQLKLTVSDQTFTAFLLSRGNYFNALHKGTEQGHINVVKTLLKYAEDISAELLYEYLASLDVMKRSAIHIAIQYNHSDIAAYIIKKIPSDKIQEAFNYCSALEYNILHHLSFTGNSDIITLVLQLLKEHSSEEDLKKFLFTQDIEGGNALHRAAVSGHKSVVEILLDYAEKISPELQYKYLTSTTSVEKRNTVHLSVLQKNDIAASLLEKIPTEKLLEVLSSCDHDGCTIFHSLAYSSMTDVLKIILYKLKNTPEKVFQAFSHPGKKDYNTLHIAAHEGHFEFVKILLQYVAENLPPEFQYRYLTSANDKKRNAIHNAIKKNHSEVAGWMLDKIPTEKIYEFVSFVDHKGFNILHQSAFIGSDKLVELIFSKLEKKTCSENIAELLSNRTHEGHSAYTSALLQGHLNLSETILQFNNLHSKRSKQESAQ